MPMGACICWGTCSGSPCVPILQEHCLIKKSNGSNVLRSFLVYQAGLWLILCAICVHYRVFLFLGAMLWPQADSQENSLIVPTACSEVVYCLGENWFGLLIFAGSQSRAANKTFTKSRTQCALPVLLMLSCSHTESIFLSLRCSSSALPLSLQRNKVFSTDNRDSGMHHVLLFSSLFECLFSADYLFLWLM